MTYILISAPFLFAAAVAVGLSLRRRGAPGRLRASAYAAAALVVLTAIFDNVMIAVDLYSYPAHLVSGIRIGLAPLEDFAYPIAVAFGLPAVGALIFEREVDR